MRVSWSSNAGYSSVRVEAVGVEAQQLPRLAHVLGQRRRDVDLAAGCGMRDDEAAGVQMQLGLDAAVGQHLVALVLVVADDRVADQRHVRAQLVLAAGDGLQRHP